MLYCWLWRWRQETQKGRCLWKLEKARKWFLPSSSQKECSSANVFPDLELRPSEHDRFCVTLIYYVCDNLLQLQSEANTVNTKDSHLAEDSPRTEGRHCSPALSTASSKGFESVVNKALRKILVWGKNLDIFPRLRRNEIKGGKPPDTICLMKNLTWVADLCELRAGVKSQHLCLTRTPCS